MKYFKFLYKDIIKHKLLFCFLVFIIFLNSVMIIGTLNTVKNFYGTIDYNLHISKQYEAIDSKDREIINQKLIDLNRNLIFTIDVNGGTNVYLLGDYGDKLYKKYKNLDEFDVSSHQKQKILDSTNLIEAVLVYPLLYISNIENNVLLDLLITQTDDVVIKEIAQLELNTLKFKLLSSKDERHAINLYTVIFLMVFMVLLAILMIQNCIKFYFFTNKNEFQINQFCGATTITLTIRVSIYLLAIYILKTLLQNVIGLPIDVTVDGVIFLSIFMIMLYYILQLERQGRM